MVLLVFLVDTSASMNQKTCLGTSYLDIAKGAVESFLKIRARDSNASRGDRYMLVTFDEPRVKAGWRENLQVFTDELKNLQAVGLSDLGSSLRETFDLLNMHRLQSGIDNYAMGRNPFYLEPALVLVISDGNCLVNIDGTIQELVIPNENRLPGGELTKEEYRWDQRLFALSLKIPGFVSCLTEKQVLAQQDDTPLSVMCDATGGKLYSICNHKSLMQSMESIAQKINIPGAVISFEKFGPDPEPVAKEDPKPPGGCTPKREDEVASPVPMDTEKFKNVLSMQPLPMNGFLPPRPGFFPPPPGLMINGPPISILPQLMNGPSGLIPPPPLPPALAAATNATLQGRVGGSVLSPNPGVAFVANAVLQASSCLHPQSAAALSSALHLTASALSPISSLRSAASTNLISALPTLVMPPAPAMPMNHALSMPSSPMSMPNPAMPLSSMAQVGAALLARTQALYSTPPIALTSLQQIILPNGPLRPGLTTNGPSSNVAVIKPLPPVKTEGLDSSSPKIPADPIRGAELAELDKLRSDALSPAVPALASTVWHKTRRMIFVRTNVKGSGAHWPIPENFWPDTSMGSLPARDAHPSVKFLCVDTEPMVIDNMPFDKYELEPSPLTQFILERKQPTVAWQTFVSGSSSHSELGFPFGYLKASTNLQCVNFFVMPYNYPCIMPLLDELFKVHKCKPTPKWRQSFDEYLQTMPSYYAGPLRNALRRMGAPNNLVPDHVDGSLSYSINAYLKKVKHQAKVEAERLINIHSQKRGREPVPQQLPAVSSLGEGKPKDYRRLLVRTPTNRQDYRALKEVRNTKKESSETKQDAFVDKGLPILTEKFLAQGFRNPFDISRKDILSQVARMRTNFFHQTTTSSLKMQDEDVRHSVSIAQMGNYQDFLLQNKPLREVDPTQVRVNTFGNPFKLKQDQMFAIDEADLNDAMATGLAPARKRVGESVNNNSKMKKKRTETPPPSRRPVGPPNTPPPKPVDVKPRLTEPVKLAEANALERVADAAGDALSERIDDIVIVKTFKEAEFGLKDSSAKENSNRNDKKPRSKSVNQQLRKLQAIHRLKKEGSAGSKADHLTELVNGRLEGDVNDGASPILSILRDSLEDGDDKDDKNDELEIINNKSNSGKGVPAPGEAANRSSSSLASTLVVTPVELTASAKRKARLQLQKRPYVKLRLAIFREIRNRPSFQSIHDYISKFDGSNDAKSLLVADVIEECDRFQMSSLSEKLRGLEERILGASTPMER